MEQSNQNSIKQSKSGQSNTNDFLCEIYRGAKQGANAIETLLPKTENRQMKDELFREQREYRKIEDKAIDALNRKNVTPQPASKMQEMAMWAGIQMNTVIDTTPSHIADILIQGNNMGIIGITKTMNCHRSGGGKSNDKSNESLNETTKLADEMIKLQQENIDNLKKFL